MSHSDGSALPAKSGALSLAPGLTGGLTVRATHRETGEVLTQSVRLPAAILGRAQGVGIRLDDSSVSRWHAYLQLVDGVPYGIDLGSRAGVLWDNGNRGRGWVHPDQTVRIGAYDVQITGPESAPHGERPIEALAPTLDVHVSNGPSGRYALDAPVTLIGRHSTCDLRLLDEATAYFHCVVVKTREGLWCVDIMSPTGTTWNGRSVRVAPLRDGDALTVGKVSIVVRAGAPKTTTLIPFGPADAGNANSAMAVMGPIREMMDQFQQCFGMMARMFTTMQQEHTAMMREQMQQLQELIRESRTQPPAPAVAPPPIAPPPAAPAPTAPVAPPLRTPTPKPANPEDADRLADAHSWFLGRLHQSGANQSKPK